MKQLIDLLISKFETIQLKEMIHRQIAEENEKLETILKGCFSPQRQP